MAIKNSRSRSLSVKSSSGKRSSRALRYAPKGKPIKIYVSALVDWIPKGEPAYDDKLKEDVLNLSDKEFKDITRGLLFFLVNEVFRIEIRKALVSRARHYLDQLKTDAQTLGHGAFDISYPAINKMMSENLESIERVISAIVHNPRQTQVRNFDYKKTFERIVKYRKGEPGFSVDQLKKDIRFNAYDGCEDVKILYGMRFEKKADVIQEYGHFIETHLLSNPDLTTFIRGSKKTNIDYKDFEDARKRFRDSYLGK